MTAAISQQPSPIGDALGNVVSEIENLPIDNTEPHSTLLPASSYQVQWPADLYTTGWQKVAQFAAILFSTLIFPVGIAWLIGVLIRNTAVSIILPAAKFPEVSSDLEIENNSRTKWDGFRVDLLQRYPEATRFAITTPDGYNLDCVHYQHPDLPPNGPTIIYYNGNGSGYEQYYFTEAEDQKVNYIRFNYRGVGRSEGSPTPEGLQLDAISIIEYALNVLQVPRNQLLLHGHSLGGYLATYAAARYQGATGTQDGIRLFSDRSFSSLSQVTIDIVTEYVGACLGKFANYLLGCTGWNYDAVTPWNAINVKYLAWSDNDQLIAQHASLAQAVANQAGVDIRAMTIPYLTMDLPPDDSDAHNRDFNPREDAAISQWIQGAIKV
jgi:pimeloyl-ACP methyl ester carboxylesterase